MFWRFNKSTRYLRSHPAIAILLRLFPLIEPLLQWIYDTDVRGKPLDTAALERVLSLYKPGRCTKLTVTSISSYGCILFKIALLLDDKYSFIQAQKIFFHCLKFAYEKYAYIYLRQESNRNESCNSIHILKYKYTVLKKLNYKDIINW